MKVTVLQEFNKNEARSALEVLGRELKAFSRDEINSAGSASIE